MKRIPQLLCILALLTPVSAAAAEIRALKSFEFSGLNGPVRLQDGRVAFAHADASGNAHNAVLLDPADGTTRNVVESVPGVRFITEDARYLVYSSGGGDTLAVRDKSSNALAASVELRRNIQWGRIDRDRLVMVQGVAPYTPRTTALVYSLPSLRLEKSVDMTGGIDTALWGEKIVSIGLGLGIYGPDLRKIALVDMPPRAAGGEPCSGTLLRISGDKAVVATVCGQLVVVDLPSARVERIIPVGAAAPSFDVSEGVIFAADPAAAERAILAIDPASGVELDRLAVDTDFVAVRGNRLLGMKKAERFGAPARFTLYELDMQSIKSETARMSRVKEGCGAAERLPGSTGDLHAAIDACEKTGIRSFIQGDGFAPEMKSAIGAYAIWLARTHSRYNEGAALLERLVAAQDDARLAAELANARRKASYLDPPAKDAPPTADAARAPGVASVPVDFGGYSDPVAFEGDRAYIGRWLCSGQQPGYRGVVLEVLDRKSFQLIKQVDIAACDFAYQDAIAAITRVPGYVVLGLNFRLNRPGRSNVVVVDEQSLTVKASGFIATGVARLRRWRDRLLDCGTTDFGGGRLDPETARLEAASADETRACVKGGSELKSSIMANSALMPLVETAEFRAEQVQGGQEFSYRIASLKHPAKILATLRPRSYTEVFPVSARDALMLSSVDGPYRRFMLYEMATRKESVLFELKAEGRPVTSAVWDDFLFVALGRDLLVYDLGRRMTVKYEKGFLGQGGPGDRNGVKRFLVDTGRLIASTFDDASSRVIDLDVYLDGLPERDFFGP